MSVYKRKGSPFYQFEFWINGHRFRGSTGENARREAEAFEREERKRREAEVSPGTKTAPLSLDAGCDRYWVEIGQHHKRSDQTRWSLNWLIKELGADTLILDISNSDVARIVALRRGQPVENVARKASKKRLASPKLVSPARVNRSVTEPLRKVLLRASDVWGETVQKITWRDHMLKEPKERVRELKADEESALMPELPEHYLNVASYALRTGRRIMECINLKWDQIDWGNREIKVLTKGDVIQIFPITASVRDLLWSLRGRHDEFVFVREALDENDKKVWIQLTYSGTVSALRRAKRRAGVTNFRLHDFRHTRGTRVLRQTGNLVMAQKALGHSTIETTVKYAHVLNDELRQGMEATEAAEKARETPTKSPALDEDAV